jgi:hypothetical protein
MAEKEKPFEYQRRIRDTKVIAQRLDLGYLRRAARLLVARSRATWALVGFSVLAGVPLVTGIGPARKSLENGLVSESHAFFEQRCELCHTQSFHSVPDLACKQCHDGAPHPAKEIDAAVHPKSQVRCAECHLEHRGRVRLAEVSNGNCTSCHANIQEHADGAKVKDASAFRKGRHPEFSFAAMPDQRPLKLNHAKHMPKEAKMFRGNKLPMECTDCHVADRTSPTNQPKPVTFEEHCKKCHSRELEFDVYQILGDKAMPSPHTKDAKLIREVIWNTYAAALRENPVLARKPLGNDLDPQPDANAWMERVVRDSQAFLFGRKCGYCHVTTGDGEVRKVNRIAGHYAESKPEGEPWLTRGDFSHRSHRGVRCDSCHTTARESTRTEDILIPAMQACTPCHGESGTSLDDCAKCHLYHNRTYENPRAIGGPLAAPVQAGRPDSK